MRVGEGAEQVSHRFLPGSCVTFLSNVLDESKHCLLKKESTCLFACRPFILVDSGCVDKTVGWLILLVLLLVEVSLIAP
jgi:hypothetical protein